ncbi:CBS domain protein [hydrothermal vent metagenome]|uniref:CBS domain protein n=1 Tax=hydrothermal vent metagenome TaxID=652676 RepID=A0A1W1C4K4_9ZZZZ
MLVKDIMTPSDKLILVSPMNTVRDAIKQMREHSVRSVIVEKTGTSGAYGILTFKNLLETIVAEEGDIDLLNVYDIATTPAISISAEIEVKYAARMMVSQSIKRLLVIDNNEIRGILGMSDIINILMDDID